MEDKVIIEWTYTPENYFEDECKENLGTFEVEIGKGRVRATLPYSTYGGNKSVIDEIHCQVMTLFRGVQVISHSPFNLSKYAMYRESSDGKKHHTVFVETGVFEVGVGKVDFVITDSDGNVISDSKANRIREELESAKLSLKHRNDSTLKSLLSSNKAAVEDPANELIHLYEIRDALKKKFGNEKTAKSTLGISETDWSRLGYLSNTEPLKQGRHRGQKFDISRDATNEELAEARKITKDMILAYLKHID